jgi:hypothetical protein
MALTKMTIIALVIEAKTVRIEEALSRHHAVLFHMGIGCVVVAGFCR